MALKRIRPIQIGRIWCAAALVRRDRQRKDRSIFAGDTRNAGAAKDRAGVGPGDRIDVVDGAAMPRLVWRTIRRSGGAALRAYRCGARAGMVASTGNGEARVVK